MERGSMGSITLYALYSSINCNSTSFDFVALRCLGSMMRTLVSRNLIMSLEIMPSSLLCWIVLDRNSRNHRCTASSIT
jgi:hypothetical protein